MDDEQLVALAKELRPQMTSDRFKYDPTAIEDVLRIVRAATAQPPADGS